MKALRRIRINDLLFIDIETVRIEETLQLDTPLFDSWEYKMQYEMCGATNEELIDAYEKKASLYPEFARIACITLGYVNKSGKLNLKTYSNKDEKALLGEFMNDLHTFSNTNPRTRLAGHFIIYFDIPFITRRSIINQVEPHELVDTSGDKPWEITAVDTNDLWKGTSPNKASLINIAVALGLPSPKDDISGSQVGDVYYGKLEGGIDRIVEYCEKDVITVANILRKMRMEPILEVQAKTTETSENISVVQTLFDGGKYTAEHKDKLIKAISAMDEDEKTKAFVVLKAMISSAKGTKTKFTIANLNELKEACK